MIEFRRSVIPNYHNNSLGGTPGRQIAACRGIIKRFRSPIAPSSPRRLSAVIKASPALDD